MYKDVVYFSVYERLSEEKNTEQEEEEGKEVYKDFKQSWTYPFCLFWRQFLRVKFIMFWFIETNM